MGHLTVGAAPDPGLTGLTLLGVYRYRGDHIFHSFLSIPVGPYDPDRGLFGCLRKLPPEGLPAITEILLASFVAQRGISAVP